MSALPNAVFTVEWSRPDNAVNAYRDSLVTELDRRLSILRNNSLAARRVKDSARFGGEITALQTFRDFIANMEIVRSIK